MGQRRVTHIIKDDKGEIIELCNPKEYWSPVSVKNAIDEIELEYHSYYLQTKPFEKVFINVFTGEFGKRLSADQDNKKLKIMTNVIK